MKSFLLVFSGFLATLILSQHAGAQSASLQAYVGQYEQRKFTIDQRQLADADLEIKEAGSTYKEFIGDRRQARNGCIGKSVPINIIDSTDQKISLLIKFSSVFPECQDRTIDLYKKTVNGMLGLAPTADSVQLRFVKK